MAMADPQTNPRRSPTPQSPPRRLVVLFRPGPAALAPVAAAP